MYIEENRCTEWRNIFHNDLLHSDYPVMRYLATVLLCGVRICLCVCLCVSVHQYFKDMLRIFSVVCSTVNGEGVVTQLLRSKFCACVCLALSPNSQL